ncbi:recombinase family protein [Nitrosovibrio tenuis]|uniref:recombinase family protein n=1 Tax=Nitrosovibrio tenuis TaxID=1233 RepID=UPI000B8175D4
MKQLIETIETFQNQGIGLKSLQDPIDPVRRAENWSSTSLPHLAEFESGVIRERTNAGLRAARDHVRQNSSRRASIQEHL